MQLIRALRLDERFPSPDQGRGESLEGPIAFVGAGGKTSALFLLGRELLSSTARTVLLTATTHLAAQQTTQADHHILLESPRTTRDLPTGLLLFTGPLQDEKTTPVKPDALSWLHETSRLHRIPLLIEADGARTLPLKAPAEHEPAIPDFAQTVVVVAGLTGLGQPLDADHIHRPQLYSKLSGLPPGASITPESLVHLLSHPRGGLKNIPPHARRVALLNQADTPDLQAVGGRIARQLLHDYDAVLVGSLRQNEFQTIEQTACIILAAGESTRFGQLKQLLDWRGQPFVRRVAQTALQADLGPVTVVVGHHAPQVESALSDLPVTIVHNPDHAQGQSTSIRAGLANTASRVGSAIFLLADQPQIPVEVLRALAEQHAQSLPAILAPLVLEETRANPVLFDRLTFPDLLSLTGDVGGRAIFGKHRVEYLPWHDDLLLLDVDTPEDYERLTRSA